MPEIPEGGWKSWTPLLLGIHNSLEPMPRCTSGLRQGILIIFKFIMVQKPDLSISPLSLGIGISNWITLKICQIFWLSFEYFSSYLCKKMQRHLPFRECFNLILGEAEDMETKCRLCTLCLLSRGSRATFWLGQQWPQALHPPLGNSHPASNQLTILQIVCVTNIEG